EAGKAADIKRVRQVASDLNADLAVWGSFRRRTNAWTARVLVLRLDTEAALAEIEATAPGWVGLGESLALRLGSQLGRKSPEDDRERWKLGRNSEAALRLVAKAMAMAIQQAPASEQEKVLRQALAEDPGCTEARSRLLPLQAEAGELEEAVREYL